MATTYYSSRWKAHYVYFGGGRVTVRDAAILTAVQKAFGHKLRLTQGGLSMSVKASSLTHAGIGSFDLSVRGYSKSQVWHLCSLLISCGMVAFPRGFVWDSFQGRSVSNISDGNEHVHVCSNESYASLHPQAQAQVREWKKGGDGLVGSRKYTGPSTKLGKWSTCSLNPANQKPAKAAAKKKAAELARKNQTDHYVDVKAVKKLSKPAEYWVATGTLQGLHVTRKAKKGTLRKKGYHVVVSKLVYRWGRWNAVTDHDTYYAIKDSKQTYLTTKNPKPAPKPVVVEAPTATVPMSTSGLSPWAAKYWPAMADRFEGTLEYAYADVLGKVTCGTGNLIDSVAAAQALPWLTKDNKPASKAEVAAEWSRVKKYATTKVKDLPGAKGTQLKDERELRKLGGRAFKPYTTLHLSDAAVSALLTKKTAEFVARFVKDQPGWSTWDPAAQLAAMDLMWQNGPAFTSVKNSKGVYVWANTRAAFLAQDWARAAKAVPGDANSARRLERVRLFTNAAASKAAAQKKSTVVGSVVAGAVVALAASAGQAVSTPAPVKPPVVTPSVIPTPAPTAKPSPSATPTVIDCASGCHITITSGS